MPKFCTQCGSQLNDDALFCSSCGAKVIGTDETTAENTSSKPVNNETEEVKADKNTSADNVNTVTETEKSDTSNGTDSANENEKTSDTVTDNESINNTPAQETPAARQPSDEPTAIDKGIAFAKDKIGDGYDKFKTSPNRDKYIGFSAIGIVIIVIICLLASIFFGGGYKSAVKDYMNAVENGDFDDYANSLPKIIYKSILKNQYDGDKDSMENDFEKSESDLSNVIDDIDYDILDVDKIDSDDVEESLREQYELYVDEKIKVSKAYQVDIKIIAELNDDFADEENRIRQTLIVAKVNGDWGVINNPIAILNNLL